MNIIPGIISKPHLKFKRIYVNQLASSPENIRKRFIFYGEFALN